MVLCNLQTGYLSAAEGVPSASTWSRGCVPGLSSPHKLIFFFFFFFFFFFLWTHVFVQEGLTQQQILQQAGRHLQRNVTEFLTIPAELRTPEIGELT
jgi:hypothetical protein